MVTKAQTFKAMLPLGSHVQIQQLNKFKIKIPASYLYVIPPTVIYHFYEVLNFRRPFLVFYSATPWLLEWSKHYRSYIELNEIAESHVTERQFHKTT